MIEDKIQKILMRLGGALSGILVLFFVDLRL
jgi:hypothetical protein